MPGAARLGDKAQVDQDAHGCPACPHPGVGPIVAASADVFTNGKPQGRQDDLGIHAVCCGPNNFQIAKGSPTVYVNGKPAARMQDKTKHCGGSGNIIEGSPDVLLDDGADAEGLGSYVIKALKILLEKSQADKKKQAKKISDTHADGGAAGTGGAGASAEGRVGHQDLSADQEVSEEEKKSGSIASARWSVQRITEGQEAELRIECKALRGNLTVEIWIAGATSAQDKKVQSETVVAAKRVRKKVKLEIPAAAARTNESRFYFVVKDGQGGQKKSDPIFVVRRRSS